MFSRARLRCAARVLPAAVGHSTAASLDRRTMRADAAVLWGRHRSDCRALSRPLSLCRTRSLSALRERARDAAAHARPEPDAACSSPSHWRRRGTERERDTAESFLSRDARAAADAAADTAALRLSTIAAACSSSLSQLTPSPHSSLQPQTTTTTTHSPSLPTSWDDDQQTATSPPPKKPVAAGTKKPRQR